MLVVKQLGLAQIQRLISVIFSYFGLKFGRKGVETEASGLR